MLIGLEGEEIVCGGDGEGDDWECASSEVERLVVDIAGEGRLVCESPAGFAFPLLLLNNRISPCDPFFRTNKSETLLSLFLSLFTRNELSLDNDDPFFGEGEGVGEPLRLLLFCPLEENWLSNS